MEAPVLATTETVFALKNLRVTFDTPDGPVEAVRGIDLEVARGETLAVVGESGSGKSQAVMAAMGLLPANARVSGSVTYRGQEILGLPVRELNRLRGSRLTMVFQEPMTSLDPLYTIGRQMSEPLVEHGGLSWRAAHERVLGLLRLVGIDAPERRAASYPYELSGGQRQRVMIAMALANDPDVLIADEPTTALDVTTQSSILNLLRDLQERMGLAIVFITHDLNIVRRLADRVAVMKEGAVVEQGMTDRVFAAPAHAYTRKLLDAEPSGRKEPAPACAPLLMEAEAVSVSFEVDGGMFAPPSRFVAVNGVNLILKEGQTLGVVGESGSGKSTLGRALLRLVPSSGRITFEGADLSGIRPKSLRRLRKEMQLVFQDPYGSLSPRLTVGQIVTEGLLVHEPALSSRERDARACQALEEVALDPMTRNRFPHEFSGGQRQRIAIARAMVLKPRLVVLDEPTSALDRTVQTQIIELLRGLQAAHGLTYLFISHDLAVVRAMADEVMVMQHGRVVERGTAEDIFENPKRPYTRLLVEAATLPG
ncbi:oligopeptide transport system ATP-binding protein [Breoghania corrubedonensis]|uniref:Oligopeptide transport system ATP-binding protein n=1 Tax=Breoghania corrubedonensis TaxID=665038 RepID=A0A2T5VE33_9HYPH|nr:ABC transporter ATP-binding protein [Breoghania corrubedonensis]PTW62020.1 oligopeptide transport system ATP-binding protein [Breoghania corrubedonensis]